MAQQPHRPFESLEWYREAVRNNFRDDEPRGRLAEWARGFGMLHAHLCVYAVISVLLLLLNLLRSPEHIWADKWIMAWTVLILIHAVGVGIVWAIALWNADTPDEALLMTAPPAPPRSAIDEWGSDLAQDVEFRASDPTAEIRAPEDASLAWTGWNADAEAGTAPAPDRVSWKQASAAAWLERSNGQADIAHDAPEDKPGT